MRLLGLISTFPTTIPSLLYGYWAGGYSSFQIIMARMLSSQPMSRPSSLHTMILPDGKGTNCTRQDINPSSRWWATNPCSSSSVKNFPFLGRSASSVPSVAIYKALVFVRRILVIYTAYPRFSCCQWGGVDNFLQSRHHLIDLFARQIS